MAGENHNENGGAAGAGLGFENIAAGHAAPPAPPASQEPTSQDVAGATGAPGGGAAPAVKNKGGRPRGVRDSYARPTKYRLAGGAPRPGVKAPGPAAPQAGSAAPAAEVGHEPNNDSPTPLWSKKNAGAFPRVLANVAALRTGWAGWKLKPEEIDELAGPLAEILNTLAPVESNVNAAAMALITAAGVIVFDKLEQYQTHKKNDLNALS